jgi:hypothetical protein
VARPWFCAVKTNLRLRFDLSRRSRQKNRVIGAGAGTGLVTLGVGISEPLPGDLRQLFLVGYD